MTELPARFDAFRYSGEPSEPIGRLESIGIDDLSAGDTVIRVRYASVNFKDALAAHGRNKIIRHLPRIGGIDLAGEVVVSPRADLPAGRQVVVHGFGIGVDHDGGYAQYARVPADWVLPLPEGVSMREACILGVAGYTAALSVHTMEKYGLQPGNGPVVVTGASGGSGSIAVDILAVRGYEVTAVSGKPEQADWLRRLGAAQVLPRSVATEDTKRPMLSGQWAGAVDTVGADSLAWLTRSMLPEGVITAFGNAGGMALNTNVLPFILRGIKLVGINGNSPMPLRTEVWQRLGTDMHPVHLDDIVTTIGLDGLPAAFAQLLEGRFSGRMLVTL